MRRFFSNLSGRAPRAAALAALAFAAACADRDGPTHASGGAPARTALDAWEPRITGIAPDTLVPGTVATLTGGGFHPVHFRNRVTVGGQPAEVRRATPTRLEVVVPCAASGMAEVRVETESPVAATAPAAVRAARRHALQPGESVVVTDAATIGCGELAPSGGPGRYVVAVYNAATTVSAAADFQLSGGAPAGATPTAPVSMGVNPFSSPEFGLSSGVESGAHGRRHLELLEKNRAENERLRARFAGDERMRPLRSSASTSTSIAAVEPPLRRTIRVADLTAEAICASHFTVSATRVYLGGRLAIYEDDATPDALKAANNPAMADYYRKIGDQYGAGIEPAVRTHFGDPLRRDAVTDGNGVLVALFTPLVRSFPGTSAFVVACDQYPNDEDTRKSNTASNFGEYVYAYLPAAAGTGYAGSTPDSWYWSVRDLLAHETKHVASHAAHVANGAPFEVPWLEEGTARHAQEVYARRSVYGVGWKENTGYGSAGAPGSLYCDRRQTDPACLAASPARPSLNMTGHFVALYRSLERPSTLSPFGRAPTDDGTYWYSLSWSLVRYAGDRYAASEADFLTALNQSSTPGAANLAARTGLSLDALMGRWALALYADDLPGAAAANPDLQFPTWNLPDLFRGLDADIPAYPRPNPLVPTPLSFGPFGPVSVGGIVGGGVAYFELTGDHLHPQLLKLETPGGGAPSPHLRMAIARIE